MCWCANKLECILQDWLNFYDIQLSFQFGAYLLTKDVVKATIARLSRPRLDYPHRKWKGVTATLTVNERVLQLDVKKVTAFVRVTALLTFLVVAFNSLYLLLKHIKILFSEISKGFIVLGFRTVTWCHCSWDLQRGSNSNYAATNFSFYQRRDWSWWTWHRTWCWQCNESPLGSIPKEYGRTYGMSRFDFCVTCFDYWKCVEFVRASIYNVIVTIKMI